MSAKRILHVFDCMNVGGAETLIMNIYRNIDIEKVQFDFLVSKDKVGFYDEEIKKRGGRLIYINSIKSTNIINYSIEFFKIIKNYGNFDVIHSHVQFFSGYIMFLSYLCGIKSRISHSHTESDLKTNNILRKCYKNISTNLIKFFATNKIACSENASKELYGNSNAIFLPNGIDFSKYNACTLNLKKELGLKEEIKLLGHVGSFKKVKNHKFIIDIFKRLVKENKDIRLILVGDGELKYEIQQYIKKNKAEDKVFLLGIRKDIHNILKNLDCFIFPSIYEGLPLTLIEVQAASLKAVVSNNISRDFLFSENLITFLSLDDDKKWIEEINYKLNNNEKNIKIYINKKKSFDIKNSIGILYEVYNINAGEEQYEKL